MTWIEPVPVEKAIGLLKQLYDDAIRHTGRVSRIRRAMSLNPPVLRDSMRFFGSVMLGDSPLSRFQRELLATVVAVELNCRY
jgi:alkylhydroperoxidase family enzyme